MDEDMRSATDMMNRIAAQVLGRQPRYRYMESPREKGFVTHRYIWTTERNGDGKFISGVYIYNPKGNQASLKKELYHSKRITAKKRAWRMYEQRCKLVESREENGGE